MGETTLIPAPGMFDFYFSKRFMKHKHEVLNGKINAWRIESLKVINTFLKMEKTTELAIVNQEYFARERVAVITQEIESFEHCCISLLDVDAIDKVVLHGKGYTQDSKLIYNMAKYENFALIVRPGNSMHLFDVVTCFDNNEYLEYVFGKHPDETTVLTSRAGQQRERLYKGQITARNKSEV